MSYTNFNPGRRPIRLSVNDGVERRRGADAAEDTERVEEDGECRRRLSGAHRLRRLHILGKAGSSLILSNNLTLISLQETLPGVGLWSCQSAGVA